MVCNNNGTHLQHLPDARAQPPSPHPYLSSQRPPLSSQRHYQVKDRHYQVKDRHYQVKDRHYQVKDRHYQVKERHGYRHSLISAISAIQKMCCENGTQTDTHGRLQSVSDRQCKTSGSTQTEPVKHTATTIETKQEQLPPTQNNSNNRTHTEQQEEKGTHTITRVTTHTYNDRNKCTETE